MTPRPMFAALLAALPSLPGDNLEAAMTGGDLSVQACADDPQVAFHAVRQLASLADGIAQLRWTQTGFAAGELRGAFTLRRPLEL